MIDSFGLIVDPLVPLWVLAVAVVAITGLAGFGLYQGLRGTVVRAVASAIVLLMLVNPSVLRTEKEALSDVVVIAVDDSPSVGLAGRTAAIETAASVLETQISTFPDVEVRRIPFGGGERSLADTTRILPALEQVLADVPPARRAGVVILSDGQIHDLPSDLDDVSQSMALSYGPVHALISRRTREFDRSVQITSSPGYGLVGQTVSVSFVVDDTPAGRPSQVPVRVSSSGESDQEVLVTPGVETTIEVPIRHGGPGFVEVSLDPVPGEISTVNNRAAVTLTGVRDRLRVLLVSGLPHAGERVWRDMLKADPTVDLVHFTILRPPEKQDGTPISELSLIAFPIRELFEIKLEEFDLVIFDRFARRSILPDIYLANIADYVASGGALLEASGPRFAGRLSLANTSLGQVLPGVPTGAVAESAYRPALSPIGARHPVTRPLLPTVADAPSWGQWHRQVDVVVNSGTVVMEGHQAWPLLILDRVGEGRVAQLTSDHIWLWRRGYDGGGPDGELLRRLAHWLMKEPALEEEALTGRIEGSDMVVERRALDPEPVDVDVMTPAGDTMTIPLTTDGETFAQGRFPLKGAGPYRLDDGMHQITVIAGRRDSKELADLSSTLASITPFAEATGGAARWLDMPGDLPAIRRTAPDRRATAEQWIGLRRNGAMIDRGSRQFSVFPPIVAALLLAGTFIGSWLRESR